MRGTRYPNAEEHPPLPPFKGGKSGSEGGMLSLQRGKSGSEGGMLSLQRGKSGKTKKSVRRFISRIVVCNKSV